MYCTPLSNTAPGQMPVWRCFEEYGQNKSYQLLRSPFRMFLSGPIIVKGSGIQLGVLMKTVWVRGDGGGCGIEIWIIRFSIGPKNELFNQMNSMWIAAGWQTVVLYSPRTHRCPPPPLLNQVVDMHSGNANGKKSRKVNSCVYAQIGSNYSTPFLLGSLQPFFFRRSVRPLENRFFGQGDMAS